jgi:hypothetical protein
MISGLEVMKRFHSLAEELAIRGGEFKEKNNPEVAEAYFESSKEISTLIINISKKILKK